MEKRMVEYFEEVETEQPYDGYFYSVADAITIIIVGCICGLRSVKQIWQWATNGITQEFLKEKFQICRVPCYYWLLCLLKMVKPESMNKCFNAWVNSLLPRDKSMTIAVDGKTIRSTGKMKKHERPLHIISAQLGELGMTYAQRSVDGKSNEIPAVQKLLEELDIRGCMIVADALNCQTETAKAAIKGGGDYLLSVKDNQPTLKNSIEDYVQNDENRAAMEVYTKEEKNRDRMEKRTAYVTNEIDWLNRKNDWKNLRCIGAIHTESITPKGTSDEWHYYICSRDLTAKELSSHARLEWSVETMHWLLDVHFEEDYCRVEDLNVQRNLNIARKAALNLVKSYKSSAEEKRPLSNIMFNCLLDANAILRVLGK